MTLPACTCGAAACIFIPGSVTQYFEEKASDGSVLFRHVAEPAYPTKGFCMPCATADGWPWLESEPERRPRRRRVRPRQSR